MKILKAFFVAAGLCMVLGGCLSTRRTWENISPFYVGKWQYAENVYSGLDQERLWEGISESINVGLNDWPIEKFDEKGGRLESEWVRVGDHRRKLELRVDKSKNEEGKPGYLVSLRVLVEKTSEVYSPNRMDYTWKHESSDTDMETLLLARIRDEFREYWQKEDDTKP